MVARTSRNLGHQENWFAKGCRAYGGLIGKRPIIGALPFIPMLATITLTLRNMPFWDGEGLLDLSPLEMQWCDSSGKLFKDLQKYFEYKDKDWDEAETAFILIVADDNENVATATTLEHLLNAVKLYNSITVEQDGFTFDAMDLCARGIFPDNPNESQQVDSPCSIIGPTTCFAEHAETLPAKWKELDANPPANWSYMQYSTRPKFRGATDAEILNEISKGCFGYNAMNGRYPRHFYVGKMEEDVNKNPVYADWEPEFGNPGMQAPLYTKVNAIRLIATVEPPGGVAYRLSQANPEKADIQTVRKAVKKHAKKVSNLLNLNYVKRYTEGNDCKSSELNTPEVGQLDPDCELPQVIMGGMPIYFGDAAVEDFSNPNYLIMILTGIASFLYAGSVTASASRPFESRIVVAFTGLQLISASLILALTIMLSGGMLLSGILVGSVPMVQMGLGADDMYVLIAAFSSMGEEYIRNSDNTELMAEIFAKAGPGVVLTSVCNALSFLCGVFIPLPGLSQICLALLLCVICNLVFLSSTFMAVLGNEANRIRANKPEMLPILSSMQKKAIVAGTASKQEGEIGAKEKWFAFFENTWVPMLSKPALKFGGPLMAVILLALALVSIFEIMALGWFPPDFFPDTSAMKAGINLIFNYFQMFPVQMFIDNVDVAANQKDLIELWAALASTKFTALFPAPNWLTMFYMFLGMFGGMGFEYNSTHSLAEACPLYDSAHGGWNHSYWAPYGIASSDPETFWNCFHWMTDLPDAKDAVENGMSWHPAYMWKDLGTQQWVYDESLEYRPATWHFFYFITANTKTDDDILEMIVDMDDVLDQWPDLKPYIFNCSPFPNYWRAFVGLDMRLWLLIGIAAASVCIVAAVLLGSVKAGIIGMLVAMMIVIDVWGITSAMKPYLKFNPFIVSTCVAAAGLSVEFVSHTIAVFMIGGPGKSGPEKLLEAMKETFLPLVHGTSSTVLALMPMVLSDIPFLTKYFFITLQIVTFLGMLHGFVFLPTFLLATASSAPVEEAIVEAGAVVVADPSEPPEKSKPVVEEVVV